MPSVKQKNRFIKQIKKNLLMLLICQVAITFTLLAQEQSFRLRQHQLIQGFTKEDIEAEIFFGRNLAAKILAKYKLVGNQQIQDYVTLLGNGITAQIGRAELKYYFAVIDTDDINAYACPGGYIFITKGAVTAMNDEAQLIGVIAHEVGHVNRRHIVKQLKIRAKDDGLTSGIAAAIGGTSATARIFLNQLTEKAYSLLFEEGISKESELEADSVSLEILTTLGYDWGSYRNYLSGIADKHSGKQGQVLSKTHPSIPQRLEHISTMSRTLNLTNSHGKTNVKRFRRYQNLL